MSSMSALCKICLYYNHGDKTCGRSIVAVSKGKVYNDYAKAARLDKNRCGPQGKWYEPVFEDDGLAKKIDISEHLDWNDM